MHAVILAGGKGVRLRPYTTSLPKPLVPIGDHCSILEIILTQLADQGFRSVTLAIGHLGHLIRSFVGDGSRWGVEVRYTEEEMPLGTMGPVLGMLDDLPEHFLVMNGDVLTDMDYGALLTRHAESGAPMSIATYRREVHIDFGVLEVDQQTVVGFHEKPTHNYRVSMGVYALSAQALRQFPSGQHFGFDDLVLELLRRNTPPASYQFEGYWLDIGRPDDYDQANAEFDTLRSILLPGRADRPAGELRNLVRPRRAGSSTSSTVAS